jgi:malonyl-CoA decarboxylase
MEKNAPAELLDKIVDAQSLMSLAPKSQARTQLLAWAARYLTRETQDGKPLDGVARFHLGNGARIERLNWAADPSPKGLKQSYGLMVNYLYDLKRLDKHREMLAQGKIAAASAVTGLASDT